ncbi:hypothetical protein AB4Z01_35680, partial [Inquilinus sp. YAF38]|uniref:hypothetical protein n=1 Tax=Inquilinus sp. YAF38 TaxID=3233084 RepID=UPI003F8DCAA9
RAAMALRGAPGQVDQSVKRLFALDQHKIGDSLVPAWISGQGGDENKASCRIFAALHRLA